MPADIHPAPSEWTRGRPARQVHDDWSVAKPREQCQQFTYALVPLVGMSPQSAQQALKAQEGFTKKLGTLTRQQEKRAARAMKRTSKG